MNFFELTVLGSGGVCPSKTRNLSSIYARSKNSNFLLDMGENSQKRILQQGLGFYVDFIIITHNHLDHFLGLFGYLQTMKLYERKVPLKIYCTNPPYLKGISDALFGKNSFSEFPFEITFIKIQQNTIYHHKDLYLRFFKVCHSVKCFGVQIMSKNNTTYDRKKLEHFCSDQIKKLIQEKELEKDGKIHKIEEYIKSTEPYFKVVYSGDTKWQNSILDYAKGGLLIHQCTHHLKEQKKLSKSKKHTNLYDILEDEKAKEVLKETNTKILLVHLGSKINPKIQKKYNEQFLKKKLNIRLSTDGQKVVFTKKECIFR